MYKAIDVKMCFIIVVFRPVYYHLIQPSKLDMWTVNTSRCERQNSGKALSTSPEGRHLV